MKRQLDWLVVGTLKAKVEKGLVEQHLDGASQSTLHYH